MALFTGFFDCKAHPPGEDEQLRADLRRLVRGMVGEDPSQAARGNLFVVWHDGMAFPDPGRWVDGDRLCLLAGDPIFGPVARPRSDQAAELAEAIDGIPAALARCAGSFALLLHQNSAGRLVLASDALGVRPLYYAERDGRLFFSTCLSIFEQLRSLPLTVSASGLFERLSLNYNLDGATPYREVRVLRQGEYLTAAASGWSRDFYCRWDRLPPPELDYAGRVRRIYELFRQAVERRSWRSRQAVAFLSGGLDSRMIAGVLHQLGKQVLAINIAPQGAVFQDEIYASRLAAALGFDLVRVPLRQGRVDWGALTMEGILKAPRPLDPSAARLVFSGDGGSVGLGLVYYEPETIPLLRSGRAGQALQLYLSRHARFIPGRYLHREARLSARERLFRTALALTLASEAEPGRQFHLFLVQNDQRTHLHQRFETMAGLGYEILTPFFDIDLVRFVLSCPVDDFAGHRLYHDLLPFLPQPVSQIPWQTYPGHLPCPVAENAAAGVSQFSQQGRRKLSLPSRPEALAVLRLALGRFFPSPPFRRLPVLATAAAGLLGWERFAYLHSLVQEAAPFFRAAEGRFVWDFEDVEAA